MAKLSAAKIKPPKQNSPAFRDEAPKLAQRTQLHANSVSTNRNFIPGVASNSRACPHLSVSRNLRPINARLKRQLAEQAEKLVILQKAATYFAKRLVVA